MEKSTVFIASSSRTLVLADKLQEMLETGGFCKAALWNEASRQKTGATIMEMLEDATRDYDFAVIILSKDDVVAEDTGSTKKARDNCVFEAGLFIATLGRERCFLLNSVEQADLPSDLGGLISLPFEEPKDLMSREKSEESIKKVARIIKDRIERLERREDKPISQEDLLEREKLKEFSSSPAELLEDQVVVLTVQPVELGRTAARQAYDNIINGGVEYTYLLKGDADGARKVCKLLQMILLSPWIDEDNKADFTSRDAMIKDKDTQSKIVKDLKTICLRQGLKVIFLDKKPILQYCIHNASDSSEAVLYVKHRDAYIRWENGERAHEFWNQERTKLAPKFTPPAAIFFGAERFDICSDPFASVLKSAVRKYFPGIHERVWKLCFDGKLD